MKHHTQTQNQSQQPQAFKPKLSVIAASVALALSAPAWAQMVSTAVTTTQTVGASDSLTVTPSGSVTVTADGDSAEAINVDPNFTGSITNQGAISSVATGTTSSIDPWGNESADKQATSLKFTGNISSANLLNSGPISAQSTGLKTGTNANASASAKGIYVVPNSSVNGFSMNTSGGIFVRAQAGIASAENSGYFSASAVSTAGIFFGSSSPLSANSSLNNSGDITVQASGGSVTLLLADSASGSAQANAQVRDVSGIRLRNLDNSSLTNSGNIAVTADNSKAYALAVYNGTLSGPRSVSTRVQDVFGIRSGAVINGSTLTNRGDISLFAKAGLSEATGSINSTSRVQDITAIYLDSISNLGQNIFDNSGKIYVEALGGKAINTPGGGLTAQADTTAEQISGIRVDADVRVGVIFRNSGAIQLKAQGGESIVAGSDFAATRAATVMGIRIAGNANGLLTENSGNIFVMALGGIATSTAGRANADASVSSGNGVHGIFVSGSIDGRSNVEKESIFRNSGNIQVRTQAGTADALLDASALSTNVSGIWISSNLSGTALINSGELIVQASAGTATSSSSSANASASAYGIRMTRVISDEYGNSSFNNQGNVTVAATAGSAVAAAGSAANANADAYGLVVFNNNDAISGRVTNSGNITTLATAGTGTTRVANAYAIYVGGITSNGTFTSTGNLIARASGDSGTAGGFYVNGAMNGSVTLQGVIKGVGPTQSATDSYAVHFGSGDGTLAINAPTYFVGSLKMADQDVTLTSGKSHSVHWKFDGGSEYTLLEGDGVPWFSRNGGIQSKEYATYDPSGQALQDQVVASVARFGDHHMRRHLLSATGTPNGKGTSTWAYVGHSNNDLASKSAAVNDLDVRSTGVVGGLVMDTDNDFTLGLMGGAVVTKAAASGALAGAQKLDASSAFVGASLGKNINGLMLDGGMKLGYTDMGSSRFVNHNLAIAQDGLERAKGDFKAKWTSASVGVSYNIAVNERLTLTPTAQLSQTRAKMGGYSESGATANATVGGRTLRLKTTDIGVQLAQKLESGVLRGSLAYVSTKASGPSTLDVTLIGNTKAVNVYNASYSAPKLGLGYTYTPRKNLTVNLDASALAGGSYKGLDVSARLHWLF